MTCNMWVQSIWHASVQAGCPKLYFFARASCKDVGCSPRRSCRRATNMIMA